MNHLEAILYHPPHLNMKPLKILHTDFHAGWGGQAARVLMLSTELVARGHRVGIAAPRGELARRARMAGEGLEGLTLHEGFRFRPPGNVPSFVGDCRRMSSLLRREDFDIVHVHGSQDSWVTATVRALTGRPRCLVMTRHNTKRVRTGPPNRYLYGKLIDHLIIVDESVRKRYETFLADGTIDPSRISVVPSAYRQDLFHEGVDGTVVRRELAIPDDAVVIGVAGRLVRDKGHAFLLKAASMMLKRVPRLVLVFAGAGPNESAVKEEARALGLADRVKFLGFRDDIPRVEAAFDIAVLPSVGCDASSASIKEAMALGKPVVSSDIGGARGIIHDGVTGIIVTPGRPDELAGALNRLIDDPAAARAMGQEACRQVSSRYSPTRLVEGTLEAYAIAMNQVPSGRAARQDMRRTA